MIEQLLSHKDSIPYALAIAAIILATTVGYMLGKADPEVICAKYVVDLEQCEASQREQSLELAECKSKGAATQVFDCKAEIKKAVNKALKDHKDIVCSD